MAVVTAIVVAAVSLAVTVYSIQQQKKASRNAAAATEQAKGFQLVIEGESKPAAIAYGRNRIAGSRVWHETKPSITFVNDTNVTTLGVGKGAQGYAFTLPAAKNSLLLFQQAVCVAPIEAYKSVIINDSSYLYHTKINDFNSISTTSTNNPKKFLKIECSPSGNMTMTNLINTSADRREARFQNFSYTTAYVKLDPDDPQFQEPPDLSFLIWGKKISTLSINSSNQVVVSATKTYSTNPALILLDYLTDTFSGKAIPLSEIDLESFYTAAIICDTTVKVNSPVGGEVWTGESQVTSTPAYIVSTDSSAGIATIFNNGTVDFGTRTYNTGNNSAILVIQSNALGLRITTPSAGATGITGYGWDENGFYVPIYGQVSTTPAEVLVDISKGFKSFGEFYNLSGVAPFTEGSINDANIGSLKITLFKYPTGITNEVITFAENQVHSINGSVPNATLIYRIADINMVNTVDALISCIPNGFASVPPNSLPIITGYPSDLVFTITNLPGGGALSSYPTGYGTGRNIQSAVYAPTTAPYDRTGVYAAAAQVGASKTTVDPPAFGLPNNSKWTAVTIAFRSVFPEGNFRLNLTRPKLPLYECNLAIDTSKPVRENVEDILGTMGDARLVWSQGKYKLQLQYPGAGGALYQSQADNSGLRIAMTITDAELKQGTNFSISWPSSSERFNSATVRFLDESNNFKEESATWPSQSSGVFARGFGGKLYEPTNFDWTAFGNNAATQLITNYGVWNTALLDASFYYKFVPRETGNHTLNVTFDDIGSITIISDMNNGILVDHAKLTGFSTLYSQTFFLQADQVYTILIRGLDAGAPGGMAFNIVSPTGLTVITSRDISYDNMTVETNSNAVYQEYLAEDNNMILNEDVFVPGITDYYHALAKAEQIVRTSRSAYKISFTYIIKDKFLEPGDYIKIESETLKNFQASFYARVDKVRVLDTNSAQVDAAMFTWQQLAWSMPDSAATAISSPISMTAPSVSLIANQPVIPASQKVTDAQFVGGKIYLQLKDDTFSTTVNPKVSNSDPVTSWSNQIGTVAPASTIVSLPGGARTIYSSRLGKWVNIGTNSAADNQSHVTFWGSNMQGAISLGIPGNTSPLRRSTAIAEGSDRIVIGTQGGEFWVSTNAPPSLPSVWTLSTPGITSVSINDIYFSSNLGLFMAVSGNTIMSSTDGFTWNGPLTTGVTSTLRTITYMYNTWFAAGDNGTLLASTNNGASWVTINTNTTIKLEKFIRIGTTLYLFNNDGVNPTGIGLGTTNGITWGQFTSPFTSVTGYPVSSFVGTSGTYIVTDKGQLYLI